MQTLPAIDSSSFRLSVVGASIGASIRAAVSSVPVVRTASPSAWWPCRGSAGSHRLQALHGDIMNAALGVKVCMGLLIDGMSVLFMKIRDNALDRNDAYVVQAGVWKPVGPLDKIKMNHSHVELKVDVGVPDVRVEVDFDDVRLYPGPARHPVTVVVNSPLNKARTAPAYPIDKLKVRLLEKDSNKLLGKGVTDEGGQARVTLKSEVLYPVAARIEVSNEGETLLTSSIPREGVRGLYPSDTWVVNLPTK